MTTNSTRDLTIKKVSRATLRPYILLTLSHAEAEKRNNVTPKVIVERITEVLTCNAIIVTKEDHQAGGFHFHIAIESKNASRNTATRLLRDTFTEFEGAQCSVKFHKSWATLCAYVTKQDKNPYLWGQYTMEQIKEQADIVRKHRRGSHQSQEQTDQIYQKLKESEQWLDVYKDETIRVANLNRYQNIKRIFHDLKTIQQIDRDPIKELNNYLKKKGYPEEYEIEYLREKYIALDWLAINLLYPRSLKAKQLCIKGRPSTQKSLLFKQLSEVIATYVAGTRMNDFTDAHDFFDLWVLDEFKEPLKDEYKDSFTEAGQVYFNTLLRVLDGQECKLDAKYQSVFTKRNNVPVICATNELGPELKRDGPLNERFIFTIFNTRIQDIQPERILATLYGCILRRVHQRCRIAGYAPEEQKRIMDSPENLIRFMREKKFEIRYNELEVQVGEEELKKKKGNLNLVFSPQPETKKGIYAKIEIGREMKLRVINPYETNPEKETQSQTESRNILDTRGLRALNKNQVGLIEIAKIPLKKRKTKIKRTERQEDHEKVKAYVLTQEELLLVYRRKGSRAEDYAAWPIMLEAKKEGRWEPQVIKTNFGEEINEKEFMGTLKKEEKRENGNDVESTQAKPKEKGTCRAVLKLGIRTRG